MLGRGIPCATAPVPAAVSTLRTATNSQATSRPATATRTAQRGTFLAMSMSVSDERRPPARGKRKRSISPTRSGTDHLVTDSDPTGAAVHRSDRGATSVLSAMWDQLDETHDVQLLVKEDGEDVLSARTVRFSRPPRATLSHCSAAGARSARRSTVPLHDVDARSVRSLLLFVYGQRVELTWRRRCRSTASPTCTRSRAR